MFLIGLTGGIASGKSTVAAHWVGLGAVEIDADQIARDVVKPGTEGLAAICKVFSNSVLNADGSLNRTALGELVFTDANKRLTLEAIVHPLVQAQAHKLIEAQPQTAMVVYNAALLVEAGVKLNFDRVVTVEAPTELQVERMMATRNLTRKQALQRIGSQTSSARRANYADYIINSNQDLNRMLKDAGKLWLQFEKEAAAKLRTTN